jgi:serine/threonine-protein kinase HipA
MGNAPSTHILKPGILRNDITVFASAVNETILMLAAAKCGLNIKSISTRNAQPPDTNRCRLQ